MNALFDVEEKVRNLVEPILESEGLELAYLEFKKGRGRWYLRIFIDKEDGVTVDDCASISSQVSHTLDVEDVITGSYTLEVSSPGLDRPLWRREDYNKFNGRMVRINTYAPIEGRKVFVGRLKGLEEERVVVEVDDDVVSIPFTQISKGKLEVEF